MGLASNFQATATRLLKKFDERTTANQAVLIKAGSRVFDPLLGEYVTSPPTEYPLAGAVLIGFQAALINETTIRTGDGMLVYSVTNEAGDTGDKVRLDGTEWSVVDSNPANYTGDDLTIVYKLHLRK